MNVEIFTDGAARGNPDGPGGYGAIVRVRDKDGIVLEKELSGGYAVTTNNRMELMGVIAALEVLGSLEEPCAGTVISDSRYVVDAFNKHWIRNWQNNGWMTSTGSPVKNQDLWNRLLTALAPHRISFQWVKGHADHPENERCDRLATAAADKAGCSSTDPEFSFTEVSDWDEAGAEIRENQAGKTRKTSVSAKSRDAERSAQPAQTIRIRYLSDRIEKLQPPSDSANWVDLRAAEDVALKAGEYRLIRLGVAMKLPEGYEAHVVPRSSTYKNFGIIQANHHGVIDNSYCGDNDEWMVPVIALRNTEIHVNDRICQFRIERRQPDIVFEEVPHLEDSDRGGFGSTGIQ